MRRWGRVIFVSVLLTISLSLSACFFPLDYSGFSLGLDLTGSSGAAPVEEITDQESELYSDGPIDLPVTIAKLDAPDAQKVSVSVTGGPSFDIGASELSRGGPLAADDDAVMTITGEAGAVDIAQTPDLIAYVSDAAGIDLSSETIVEAGSDGSFRIVIPISDINQKVVFAGVTADIAYSSTFLTVATQIVEEDGSERRNYVIVTTNTDMLNSGQTAMSDGSGYYYLSLDESSSSHVLMRRNLDGTQAQILEESSSVAFDHVTALSENKIAYVNEDGTLKLSVPSSIPLSLATGDAVAPQETTVTSLTKVLASLDNYEPDATKIMVVEDEDAVVLSQFGTELGVSYIRTTSGTLTDLIESPPYDDIRVALSIDQDVLYAFVLDDGTYSLYSVDLSGSIVSAWSAKVLLAELPELAQVNALDAADDGKVVIDAVTASGAREILLWDGSSMSVLNDPATDANEYANPRISRDGALVVACKLGAAGEGNQIAAFRPGTDVAGVLHDVTSEADFNVCDERQGSLYADPNNFLHFYRSNADGSNPQHAILNLSQLNF